MSAAAAFSCDDSAAKGQDGNEAEPDTPISTQGRVFAEITRGVHR